MRIPANITILVLLSITAETQAQNSVSGKVESVPSVTTPMVKVTFIDKITQEKYATLTDSLTGSFSLGVPSGTYTETVEALNNFKYQDTTITVSSDLLQNVQLIQNEPVRSTYYSNILALTKELTGTRDPPYQMWPLTRRFSHIPIREHPHDYDSADPVSMPKSPIDFRPLFDSVKAMCTKKSEGGVQFEDALTDSSYGIEFVYPKDADMPAPGALGITDEISGTGSELLKMVCYINREINNRPDRVIRTFLRESFRALGFTDGSYDPSHIMYFGGNTRTDIDDDEGYVIQIAYSLEPGTDMTRYREIIPVSTSRAPIIAHKLGSILISRNRSTSTFVSNLSQDVTDPDGDSIFYRATSNNDNVATMINNDSLFVRDISYTDSAKVFVTYKDTTGLSVRDTLNVIVVNHPPSQASLLAPVDTVLKDNKVVFAWSSSIDPDNDSVKYGLHIFNTNIDTTINSLIDTTYTFINDGFLRDYDTYTWQIISTDGIATTTSDTARFTTDKLTAMNELVGLPKEYQLDQNYPNPFNPSTLISYQLPKQSYVTLRIFDVLGREIALLVNGEQTAGYKSVTWNAANVSSGLYFYRLTAGTFTETKKLLLLR